MENTQLVGFKKRWQRFMYLECGLYAVGFAGLVYLVSSSLFFGIMALLVSYSIALLIYKPWNLKMENMVAFVDAHIPEAGFSSGLLLKPQNQLSSLSKLQRHRIALQLTPLIEKLKPPHHLTKAAMFMFGLIMVGLVLNFVLKDVHFDGQGGASPEKQIQFSPMDSLDASVQIPKLVSTSITIDYPGYTRLPNKNTMSPNIRAVEGAIITWKLTFDGAVADVQMDRMGENFPLSNKNENFVLTQRVESSGFYSFTFRDAEGNSFTTDLYSMEVTKDQPPSVEIDGLDQYSYFEFDDEKRLPLTTQISDDFGVADAFIVATVSKGSGESVKFREETLRFESSFSKGSKQLQLKKQLNLDDLKMDPGDELYFYVEAIDNKFPLPNRARSETFFAVIRDTITDEFAVEGTLGVDQMPDYFRSQRQLIIDTEKLIKDRPKLSEYDFKFKSNELGFDQKSLRLKYGQFMGDETEMQNAPGQITEVEEGHDEEGEEDLLDAYSHKHDSENEHNLVPEHEEENEEEAEDPLHDYVHNHEDPEASTLFEKSLKAKLREALNIMWDAELYLRLYEPEKSLPYQYQALKLIQEIKNSARIYVHRIGFDPPPIKEEKRLTGDIEAIDNYDKKEQFEHQMSFAMARNAVSKLELLARGEEQFSDSEVELFREAGNELAKEAVSQPMKYLDALQGLKDLDEVSNRNITNYRVVLKKLIAVLPKVDNNPGKANGYRDEINKLYLTELDSND